MRQQRTAFYLTAAICAMLCVAFAFNAHASSLIPVVMQHGDLLASLGGIGGGAGGLSALAFGIGSTAGQKTKSKFFRVALEGATTDGRNIERSWIEQMAKNFDPKKYGARIWMEHLRGVMPDGPFKAYGDVLALKAEEIEIDGAKKLALFAQIEPTPELVAMNKARQKIYTSIEINPKFADSGEAYLVGLGVTDSPASLGTDVLAFAAQKPESSPFASRKTSPGNLFSAAEETTLEFVEEETQEDNKLAAKIKDLLSKFSAKKSGDESRFADITAAVEGLATVVEEALGEITEQNRKFAAGADLDGVKTQVTELQTAFNALKEQLGKEPAASPRPTATGGGKGAQTDC
jgi:hypothetical protein